MSSTPQAVLAVLELFKGPLAELRFADVDAKTLENLAAEVELAALAVQEQEAELAALRLSLGERQDALLSLAQRALAYARVYAENDETLSARLNAISLPRAVKPRKSERARTPQAQSEPTGAASQEAAVENAGESLSVENEPEIAAPKAPVPSRKGRRRSNPESTETSPSRPRSRGLRPFFLVGLPLARARSSRSMRALSAQEAPS